MKKKVIKKQQRVILWAAKGMFKSARKLADAIKPETDRKVLIVRSDSLRFNPRPNDVVLNWGNSNTPDWAKNILPPLINNVNSVSFAVNKLTTFKMLQDKCNIPEWTTHKGKVTKEGLWVARTKLTGFGGEGIILFDPKEELPPDAPLYVQYKKKKKEFRVHVFKGEVIDITQKKKRKDFDGEINTKIRNYANGWVYCREEIEEPQDLREQATLAIGVLGLDFGAVDCIWNEKENKTYILEANTAPGLEGSTIEAYKNAILKNLQ
jgi:glutathione synthase/RimK-type ligase-like ATP-grasp enzyme